MVGSFSFLQIVWLMGMKPASFPFLWVFLAHCLHNRRPCQHCYAIMFDALGSLFLSLKHPGEKGIIVLVVKTPQPHHGGIIQCVNCILSDALVRIFQHGGFYLLHLYLKVSCHHNMCIVRTWLIPEMASSGSRGGAGVDARGRLISSCLLVDGSQLTQQ